MPKKELSLICKLPELMAKKGISQKRLAEETGLSPTTISKLYRNHIDRFDQRTLLVLCEYFGCESLSELMEIEF